MSNHPIETSSFNPEQPANQVARIVGEAEKMTNSEPIDIDAYKNQIMDLLGKLPKDQVHLAAEILREKVIAKIGQAEKDSSKKISLPALRTLLAYLQTL